MTDCETIWHHKGSKTIPKKYRERMLTEPPKRLLTYKGFDNLWSRFHDHLFYVYGGPCVFVANWKILVNIYIDTIDKLYSANHRFDNIDQRVRLLFPIEEIEGRLKSDTRIKQFNLSRRVRNGEFFVPDNWRKSIGYDPRGFIFYHRDLLELWGGKL